MEAELDEMVENSVESLGRAGCRHAGIHSLRVFLFRFIAGSF
jgi:hypothetical protein